MWSRKASELCLPMRPALIDATPVCNDGWRQDALLTSVPAAAETCTLETNSAENLAFKSVSN